MNPSGNFALENLSTALRQNILDACRPCHLPLGTVLVHRGQMPANLVFLTSGMASLVVTMGDGSPAEVGMLGNESVTGVSTLLGADVSHANCIIQIPGEGLQVPRQHLLRLFQTSAEFREYVLQLTQRQMNISAQLSACNLRHQAEARFARWLLTASDRMNSDTLTTTQEFLAEMIGTRRTTVNYIVGPLKKQGFISASRGTIRILDRDGLLSVTCECYEFCRHATYPLLSAASISLSD